MLPDVVLKGSGHSDVAVLDDGDVCGLHADKLSFGGADEEADRFRVAVNTLGFNCR